MLKKYSLVFIAVGLFICNTLRAQVIADAMSNRPYYQSAGADINGNPFLIDKWVPVRIFNWNGIVIENARVKFDIYSNTLVYESNDSVFQITGSLKYFELLISDKDTLKFSHSSLINKQLPDAYVQELVSKGSMRFYKTEKKQVESTAAYNTADGIKEYKSKTTYYIIENNNLKQVTLSKKDLEEVCTKKWQQIAAYISSNKLSPKNEKDWIRIISYYNE